MKKKLEVFQKLIDSIKTNCPGVITEDVEQQFNTLYQDALNDIETSAYQSGYEAGQGLGFKDGYAEAKRIADENLKAETEKIIAQCDEEAVAKITEILQVVDLQNTEKLEVVHSMVKEYQAELEAQDADHADKLNQVQDFYLNKLNEKDAADAQMLQTYAEAVDKKHAKQLQVVVESINNDHAAKLQKVVDAIDKKHAKQFALAMEAVDQKHAKQLKTLFEAVSADHAAKLNECVDFIDKKHTKQLKTIMEAVDKDHAKKLKQIVESINNDHANKLEVLIESIDKDHSKKLMNAVQHEKDKKVDLLALSVEKYLDYALEQQLPKKQLVSEQKYNVAMKALDKMKDYLNVNGVIQESKDGIFEDYENKINKEKAKNEKLVSENAKLNRKLQRREAQMVLLEKLKDVTPALAKYLRARFRHAASPKVILESIEDARKSFRKEQAEKRAKVQAEMRKNRAANASTSSVVLLNKEKEPVKKLATAKQNKTPDNIAEFYANYLVNKK